MRLGRFFHFHRTGSRRYDVVSINALMVGSVKRTSDGLWMAATANGRELPMRYLSRENAADALHIKTLNSPMVT